MDNHGLSLNEARKVVGVSYPVMLGLVNRPDFPAFRVGKKWIIPNAELMKWLEKQAQEKADRMW